MDPGAEVGTPPVFMAFLHLRGRDVRPLALRDRRKPLEDVAAGADLVYPARRLEDDGLTAWATVQERGYEGLVAKDERAPYNPAHPSAAWWKVKVRHEARFVVVGIAKAGGWPYALLVAERVGDQLVYRGRVEWGGVSGAESSKRLPRARGAEFGRPAPTPSAGATSSGSSRASRSR